MSPIPIVLLLLAEAILLVWDSIRIDVLESDLKRLRRQLEVK
jgi:hypothetical protein